MPTANELLGAREAATLTRVLERESGRSLPTLAAAARQRELEPLALSARAAALADAALTDLPADAAAIHQILTAALGDPAFEGWLIWPAGLISVGSALTEGTDKAFELSLSALAALTPRNTSEFAIRHLLAARPAQALATMIGWTQDEDPHVRRLASEGSRPFLPWGVRVPELLGSPSLTAPILDALRLDPDDYVSRSVGNHLNDYSRVHPDWVIETARRWRQEDAGASDKVIKRALRTLIKEGDPDALELLGFGGTGLEVAGPTVTTPNVEFGGEVRFTASVRNGGDAAARVAIDWALQLVSARGDTRRKVFKLATPLLQPGESVEIERTFSFRPISTRSYYPGEHAVELLVNGSSHGPADFMLEPPQGDEYTPWDPSVKVIRPLIIY